MSCCSIRFTICDLIMLLCTYSLFTMLCVAVAEDSITAEAASLIMWAS